MKHWKIKEVKPIHEAGVTLSHVIHEGCGAEVIHLAADDEENVFALTFKTYPQDDTGVAHILEHTTLCGSKAYPIHDPFFSMLRRSSNTFMNAFTSKLWTAYPAASKIRNDFYNLLDVYLDAVFHPLLKKTSFQQEGYRFTFEEEKLTLQGIVFNEMKGVFSNPNSVLWRNLAKGLCPDTPYGYDSGGVPKFIPNLTHKQLRDFHAAYYHPSRCIFYFYGNIPLASHLKHIEPIVSHAKAMPPIPPIIKQKRFTSPKREERFYPTQETDLSKKTFVGLSWLTASIEDREELLALTLLDSILMDTDASPLKRKLLQSGLCIDAGSVIDPDAREVPYAIILRGCEATQADAIESFLISSLNDILTEGIPEELIEASLHQLELHQLEIGAHGQPHGLELFERSIIPYLQGGSITDGLQLRSLFTSLEKRIADGFLLDVLNKHLINNPHLYRLVLRPSATLLQEMQEEEEAFLKKTEQRLSPKEKEAILADAKALEDESASHEAEDDSCLPMLSLEEIPKEVSYFPLKKETFNRLTVYHHNCFTNGLIYADLVFDLPQIAKEDLLYLRLFSSVLTELGAGGRSYVDNLKLMHRHIGGIWTSLSLNVQKDDRDTCYPTISLSGKALQKEGKSLFTFMKDFIFSPDLRDEARLEELITQSFTGMQQRLNQNAFHYALRESASSFSPWSYVSHLWHGLPYYKFLEDLCSDLKARLPHLIERFSHLSKTIFHLNNPHLVLSCDESAYCELEQADFYGWKTLSDSSHAFSPWVELVQPPALSHTARSLAYPVAHNAKSIETITMASRHSAHLKLASYLFDHLTLHREIREEGGAYQSGTKYNILTGIYQFYSSRDPNIASTYAAFDTAVKSVAAGAFSDQDLLEAKLSYIQDVDGVVSPGARASVTYFQYKVGLTKEIRQVFRDQVLRATKSDIMQAVQECLLPKLQNEAIHITYANPALLTKELAKKTLPQMTLSPL